ncbi:hypothetical protein D3C75_1292800 [compost metagenome]
MDDLKIGAELAAVGFHVWQIFCVFFYGVYLAKAGNPRTFGCHRSRAGANIPDHRFFRQIQLGQD